MSIQIDAEGGGAGSGTGAFPVETFTGALKNLVVADNLKFFVMDRATAQAIQIPDDEVFPIGAEMEFLREGTGSVTVDVPEPPVILQSRDGLRIINAQYSAVSLKKISLLEWRLIGDLA